MLERFERFSFAILKIYRSWNKLATEEMGKYGLKGLCALYLLTIGRSNGGITVTKLAEACSKDKADVSRTIALMENKGLVVKEIVNQNLYRAKILLTKKGEEAAKNVSMSACLAVENAGNGIINADRKVFYGVLEQIAENLEEISCRGLGGNL